MISEKRNHSQTVLWYKIWEVIIPTLFEHNQFSMITEKSLVAHILEDFSPFFERLGWRVQDSETFGKLFQDSIKPFLRFYPIEYNNTENILVYKFIKVFSS